MISDLELLKPGGMVFLHDVEWPWGRRDMYYQPDMIPPAHRHAWEQKGVVRGRRELVENGGYLPAFRKATREGGARNGVLTAIEDFLREHRGEYDFFRVRGKFGLGILYRRESSTRDFKFLSLECKAVAYNAVTWPKRLIKVRFPSAISLAKSLLSTKRA